MTIKNDDYYTSKAIHKITQSKFEKARIKINKIKNEDLKASTLQLLVLQQTKYPTHLRTEKDDDYYKMRFHHKLAKNKFHAAFIKCSKLKDKDLASSFLDLIVKKQTQVDTISSLENLCEEKQFDKVYLELPLLEDWETQKKFILRIAELALPKKHLDFGPFMKKSYEIPLQNNHETKKYSDAILFINQAKDPHVKINSMIFLGELLTKDKTS